MTSNTKGFPKLTDKDFPLSPLSEDNYNSGDCKSVTFIFLFRN